MQLNNATSTSSQSITLTSGSSIITIGGLTGGMGLLTSGTASIAAGSGGLYYNGYSSSIKSTKLYNILDDFIESSSFNEFHLDIIITTINTVGIEWYSSMKKNKNSCLMAYIPDNIQDFLNEKEIQFNRNKKITDITNEL